MHGEGKGIAPDAAGSPRNFFRNSELGELFRVGVAIPLRIHPDQGDFELEIHSL